MNMRKPHRFIFLAVLLSLTGCSLPGARTQPIVHYVLEVPAASAPVNVLPAAMARPVLLLREAEPGGLSQSLRLIYSRAPGTQAQYQYARWNEPPPKRLHTLLRQRLLASGLYAGVLPLGAGVQGDYQLNFRLLDFFHNAVQTPGSAHVALEVELLRRSTARLVGQQVFVVDVPLTGQDAAAAAAGLGQASGQVLDAVIAWLARVQPVDAR
jgi:cholesterol transport system auxiliary component